MATLLASNPAPGGPGIEPRWTRSDKDGVGTAYSDLSKVWFTISKGILNEVYYPTVDRPQIRDLQYLVTDGESFCVSERQLSNTHDYLTPESLGYRITNADPEGRFTIIKEIISDAYQACVLINTRFEVRDDLRGKLRLYVLVAPHLDVGGRNNTGNVVATDWGSILTANKNGAWMVLAPSVPFVKCSCAYAGPGDGWHELKNTYQLNSSFDSVINGNIALTAEIDLREKQEFLLALAFGESLHHALVTTAQVMGTSFDNHRTRFIQQWQNACRHMLPGKNQSAGDGGCLYHVSHSTLLAHEDKTFEGALIASLSIPWGEAMTDDLVGGYHLVWTRDMCQSATGLLATGDTELPLRALIYLACTQKQDGGFYQNFWINGDPHWHGIQLDEVAFPVILAWRLHQAKGLQEFDPYPMVLKAARYLMEHGPVTHQERWEENSGYSPSTLAAHIAALICAGAFARVHGNVSTAEYCEEYADFLEAHLETWTVTTQGTLLPGVSRHYIRIHPADPSDPQPDECANNGTLEIRNQPPGMPTVFASKDVVDPGFLELVRYGVRQANDPLIEDSLRVVDHVLKHHLPAGPCWGRYNHDGFGQCENGEPFIEWGRGHAWPVLTGERGHYELAAGRDAGPYIRAMEGFATQTRLLPEQLWTLPDLPEAHMFFGKPTGGAMPLAWAHAEYLQLVRSATDGRVFGLIDEVAARYRNRTPAAPFEIWKFNRQVRSIKAGGKLRIQACARFLLHWTRDEWASASDTDSLGIATSQEFADIDVDADQKMPVRFTLFWKTANRWEGHDFVVTVEA